MANWIMCATLDGKDMMFVNLDNVVSVSGNNLGSVIRYAGGEMVVADRPEQILAKLGDQDAQGA